MPERDELILDLLRLSEQMMRRARAEFSRRLDRFGLTIPQYFALVEIAQLGPGVTMGRVAEATQFPPSSMTSITDRLVEHGLVERGPHPTDRRAVVASITPAGEGLLRQVEEARRQDAVESLAGISDEDLAHFVRTFHAIHERAI
jgi:DNA-binding MarR family transcriptional regulator